MRVIAVLVFVLFGCPAITTGQSFLLHGSAGLTTIESAHNLTYGFDPGLSLAAGLGINTTPRVVFLIEFEQTNRASQLQTDARGGTFGFRGGTLTVGTGQVRVHVFPRDRVGPYGVAGFAAGVSRLDVTAAFPDRVTHGVRALVFGGGIHVPLGRRISMFADWRMMIGSEAGELLAVAPLRAGIGWNF